MTHHDVFTEEQINEINKLREDTSDAGREKFQNYVLNILIDFYTPEGQPPNPVPVPTPTDPKLPADGRLQPEKNASKDAATWYAVVMKDDATKWKVVDAEGINVADLFNSEATAKQFIEYYTWQQENQNPQPGPEPVPVPGVPGEYPYAAKGSIMKSTQRGPTTRHYRSGKPDENTIEKNVKNIKFKNYQFVVDLVITDSSQNDTVTMKIGGTHMKSGWFSNGVNISNGECCLGVEEKHPSTKKCVVKGPKIGDIRNKRIKVATTYFKDINKTELWTEFPIGSGWKKQVEGTNVNKFNPKSNVGEAQLRIDGFKKNSLPNIHNAVVTEI